MQTTRSPFETLISCAIILLVSDILLYVIFCSVDWRVRPLVCVIKEWAKRRGINDANQSSLTSYSLVMMVIHYLQCGVTSPVLPSLQQLYPERFGNRIDVRSLNMTEPLESVQWGSDSNSMSLGDLLLGFFGYYDNFFEWVFFNVSFYCLLQF